MHIQNCRGCGRLFNALSREQLCPECRKKLDEKFQQVKEYLREHPNATVDDVARNNEVSVKQIRQWVREERLAFSEDSIEGLDCEVCGRLIKTGRYCDACKSRMTTDLMSAYGKPQQPLSEKRSRIDRDGDRMRYL